MNTATDLIPATTLTQMVGAYRQAETNIRAAFALLADCEKRLTEAFGYGSGQRWTFQLSHIVAQHRVGFDETDDLMKHVKIDAWRVLVDRMQLRQVLSVKRVEELNKQLETGAGLPGITEPEIMGLLEGTLKSIPEYIAESVREVFEFLRPPRSDYKTNTEFEIGKRVILRYAVESNYSGGYRTSYQREAELRALDNVFHTLDGNGTIKTHGGPLIDAINGSKRGEPGETNYFRFRCYKNRTLHIEFKRLDLVSKLNQMAGGARLKPNN